ncbi:hypothetical protein C8Q77DRAFT_1062553 [Trametes polyzona]|nr:hypothetical protein C8Q77DRAFT_1062553 [Trametes polyzona]
MFRLPTHLESLVPPPKDQVPQTRPWRGALVLPASSPQLSSTRSREIWVTAAETENDNQQDSWPKQFQLQIVRRNGILREVHAWLSQFPPSALSRCVMMPDRLPDPAPSTENQERFISFARRLHEEGIIAIAPWSVDDPSRPGGVLLYPTATTQALLVGVIFLNAGFPEFIIGSSSHSPVAGPSRTHIGPHNLLPRPQSLQPILPYPSFDSPPPSISRHGQGGSDSTRGNRSGRHSG